MILALLAWAAAAAPTGVENPDLAGLLDAYTLDSKSSSRDEWHAQAQAISQEGLTAHEVFELENFLWHTSRSWCD